MARLAVVSMTEFENTRSRRQQKVSRQDIDTHLRNCPKCEADFHGVITMHKNDDRLAREIIEAMEIEEGADDCISTASVSLTNKEKLLLHNAAPGPCG